VEVHGFQYLDSRDLTGFIDGTENPKGAGARARAALVGEEDPVFAGGSFHDHLMDHSRAVSGANFFAPSLDVLRSLGRR
jgi:deferrochelatase/peroxidase EfeB